MTTSNDICERWRWLGIRLKEEGMHQQGDALIQAAAENAALQARVDELEANIRWIVPALHVLRGMCRTAGLTLGAAKADEMLQTLGEKP